MKAKVISNDYRPFENDKGEQVEYYSAKIVLENGLTGYISGSASLKTGDVLVSSFGLKNNRIVSTWLPEGFTQF